MNKKVVFILYLLVFSHFAVDGQQFDAESDFQVAPMDGGRSAVITRYLGTNTTVRIPPTIQGIPVTSIGGEAFRNRGLISVTIPNGVISIGNNAFEGNHLTNINIPDSVTSIGNFAFANNHLTGVTFGNSVTTIGNVSFAGNRLRSISFPDSLISIGDFAFRDNQLSSITLPVNLAVIRDGAFARNRLTSVSIPGSVTMIGPMAFTENPLTNVLLSPDNAVYILDGFFLLSRDGTQLISYFGSHRNITIPNSVTIIKSRAFVGNQLTSVTIPDSVRRIEDRAFNENPLTSITIGANVELETIIMHGFTRHVFDGGFDDFYRTWGRMAATYTRPNINSTTWTRRF